MRARANIIIIGGGLLNAFVPIALLFARADLPYSFYIGCTSFFVGLGLLFYGHDLRSRQGLTNWWVKALIFLPLLIWLMLVGLASGNCARCKGLDAAVQSDIDAIKTQAEIYYAGAGNNTYGKAGTSCMATGSLFAEDDVIVRAIKAADMANGQGSVTCNNSTKAYAVEAQLSSDKTKYWCVDSTGVSAEGTIALGKSTSCPFKTSAGFVTQTNAHMLNCVPKDVYSLMVKNGMSATTLPNGVKTIGPCP